MRVLITGRGLAGSWAIRGEQIGHAIGARVAPHANTQQCRNADVIVGVKRLSDSNLLAIRESGKPWIWDVVDAYPQPECSTWNRDQSLFWLISELDRLRPDGVIWPNSKMADDAQWVGRQEVIYHHHRPNIRVNPIRERITTLGYEGSPKYLAGWEIAIDAACKAMGASFVVNPASMADIDVVLALRGPRWNGYPQRHWKSGVKLANAHGSGTPFIGMPEDGYQEIRTGCEYWIKTPAELVTSLQWLESQSAREEVSARFLQCALPIERVAEQYKTFLRGFA